MSRGGRGAASGGRGGRTFSLESMNLSREALPLPTLQPPTAFPRLSFQALPIKEDSDQETLLEIKRDLLAAFRSSRFAEDVNQAKRSIERYSDRYSKPMSQGMSCEWDYRLFPSELHESVGKAKKKKTKQVAGQEADASLAKLPTDDTEEKDSGEESDDEAEDAAAGPAEDEEVGEEETDYALTYFDNGEDYLEADNDDNGDEGPTY